VALCLIAVAGADAAAVRLPSIFSDHMVLQAGAPDPIWGWAEPGQVVTVELNGQTSQATANSEGKWHLTLGPLLPGGPFQLNVKADQQRQINDVMVGEVWIGAGQSNMGFPFKMDFFPYLKVKDYEKEKAAANYPGIRMFIVETAGVQVKAQEDCRGAWHVTTPDAVDPFSAELFFFGRELHRTLGVPVGLIKAAVGGTPIELWIDEPVQRANQAAAACLQLEAKELDGADRAQQENVYRATLAEWEKAQASGGKATRKPNDPNAITKRNNTYGGLFNSKIAPLIPYGIAGVVWHQGENNAGSKSHAPYYGAQLELLVTDWRRRWGRDFPFAWVQLANFATGGGDYPRVREGMRQALRLPNTGMAVTIDIGEAHNIHFIDKQDVGHRLAQWALGTVYGKPVATSGPLPAAGGPRGDHYVVAFSHTDGGLRARAGPLQGFEAAGSDGRWHAAQARIAGSTVGVYAAEVPAPLQVRYAWAANPACNLYNGAGLPATPFATDSNLPPLPQ
jgi:sialate O-acetylesterase